MLKNLLTTTALVVAVAVGSFAMPTGASAEDLLIGVAGPMTGDNAAFGEQLRRGAEQAVADINAAGGVLGKQLKLEIGDDACDPKQAVQVANDLVKKGVAGIIGHFCSGSSIPASEVYAEEGLLQITPASTNPKFTDEAAAKGVTTVFRTCGRDDVQGAFDAKYFLDAYAGKNIAVVDDKTPYGQGLANDTAKNVEAGGLKLALRDTYTEKEKDFSALFGKLKQANIDAVFLGGYHTDIASFTRQAREQGFKGEVVSGDSLNTAEFWSVSGPAGEGVRFSAGVDARLLDGAKDIVAKFKAAGYDPEGYTLYTYSAIQAFAAAANGTGGTDGAKLAEWLRANAVDSVNGKLSWDEKGDIKGGGYFWYLWSNGTYNLVPGQG